MDELLAAASQLNDWGLELTVLDFEEERGRSDADARARKARLERDFAAVRARAEAVWNALPLPQIVAYEARVKAALKRLRDADGQVGNFYAESLAPRALATLGPERAFDFWALWAVHRVLRHPS